MLYRFMRPNTPHYVLTVDNAITLRRHMYSRSTIRDTCYGHIHTGILQYEATNTNHSKVEDLLHRMFTVAVDDYFHDVHISDCFPAPFSTHSLYSPTVNSLKDIVLLGNVLSFCHTYDERTYEGGITVAEKVRRSKIVGHYKDFQKGFSREHTLCIGERVINPMEGFFLPSVLKFAITLLKYKELAGETVSKFTVRAMRQHLETQIKQNWPEILDTFLEDAAEDHNNLPYTRTFDWTGEEFVIKGSHQSQQKRRPAQSLFLISEFNLFTNGLLKRVLSGLEFCDFSLV